MAELFNWGAQPQLVAAALMLLAVFVAGGLIGQGVRKLQIAATPRRHALAEIRSIPPAEEPSIIALVAAQEFAAAPEPIAAPEPTVAVAAAPEPIVTVGAEDPPPPLPPANPAVELVHIHRSRAVARLAQRVRRATPPLPAPLEQANGVGIPPALLSGPRAGGKDDLRKIKGVGKKLETVLNAVGIFHYDQIAAWTPANVAWIDSELAAKGRIAREDWVAQAAALDRPVEAGPARTENTLGNDAAADELGVPA